MKSGLLFVALGLLLGCTKTSEPPPTNHDTPTASAAHANADGGDAAHVARAPDWTLDPDDPARDYVGRYLRGVMRYGPETGCVVLSKSTFENGESIIQVRNPADSSCGKPAALRDKFFVNVSADRMRIDESEHRPPLRPWPDGSAASAGPGAILEVSDLHSWQTPLRDAIKRQQLYPVRVQLYGRGTYPVITIAGWHALFDPKGDLAALKPVAKELCAANSQTPLGFLSGIDRSTILRIDCPENPHWETL